jgi:hypothetical protein
MFVFFSSLLGSVGSIAPDDATTAGIAFPLLTGRSGLGKCITWQARKVNVMSGSKFWARGAGRQQESEEPDGAQVLAGTLTTADRCDRCGAQAYVRVLLPNALELLFCAHHNRQYASALTKIAVEIHDETQWLARVAA